MAETEKPAMSRCNQKKMTMNALDQVIGKMSVLSSDELGHMHGGFASGIIMSGSLDQNLNVNVNVGDKSRRCRCACRG